MIIKLLGPVKPIMAVILLLLGIPFLLVGVNGARKAQQRIASFETVNGIVIENVYFYSDNPMESTRLYHHSVVEYRDEEGQVQHFTDGFNNSLPVYEVGDQVEVLYDPNYPTKASVRSWKRIWFAPTLFMAIGLLSILLLLVWRCWALIHVSRRR